MAISLFWNICNWCIVARF